jgi:hypothetical protein
MTRRILSTAAVLVIVSAVSMAQSPEGWMVRADRSTNATDPDGAGAIKFMTMGTGFHAINPQAAVYWNNDNHATGDYTLSATFTLIKPSGHPNYYGLVFGGKDLAGPKQAYLYFVVAQNGTWLVKQRAGDAATANVAAKTANDAVSKPDASGRSTNALEVRVAGEQVDFVVNGTVVHSAPRTGLLAATNGIAGIRINHQLEVMVDDFTLTE